MTIQGIFLRIIRRVPVLTSVAKAIVRNWVSNTSKRNKINRWYNKLDWDGKAVFQNVFSKIFRERKTSITPGIWEVSFCGTKIRMPLSNDQIWLDWDNAISILGHDPGVKMTYENLLKGDNPVRLFFDIGANYGTHSLLFLSQGVNTVSFEPNYTLNQNFDMLCRENNVQGKMENFAVSDVSGITKLHFPPDATWLGNINSDEIEVSQIPGLMKSIEVPLITLDEYVASTNSYPDLLKIDTEGNEINVLNGAIHLIQTKEPMIIFESNSQKSRKELWDFFKKVDYRVCVLPLTKDDIYEIQSIDSFLRKKEFNFIGVPCKKAITK